MTSRGRLEDGFTLLEVLVALAILSISLVAILEVLSNGLHDTAAAQAETVATATARSLLAEASARSNLPNGDTTGRTASGYRWRLHVAPYGDRDDRQSWIMDPRQVSALVSWTDGNRDRSVALTTLLLLPKERQ